MPNYCERVAKAAGEQLGEKVDGEARITNLSLAALILLFHFRA